jgi:hypothetical protein
MMRFIINDEPGSDVVFVSVTDKPTARLANKPISYPTRVMQQAVWDIVKVASSSWINIHLRHILEWLHTLHDLWVTYDLF